MIFVIAGTQDGRELSGFLLSRGFEVTASVVSGYGRELLQRYEGLKIIDRKLDEMELTRLLSEGDFRLLVDASHPYAVNVSQNAMAACHSAGVPYLRYERAAAPIDYPKVHHVQTYAEAAEKAAVLGNNIFLTTGSRNLKSFVDSPALQGHNLIARVLPTSEVLAECEKLGFSPQNIVAMQGPFSRALNAELFRHYRAEVVVTKDGGQIGGVDAKIDAARDLNLPVVMIDRAKINYDRVARTFEEVADFHNFS